MSAREPGDFYILGGAKGVQVVEALVTQLQSPRRSGVAPT